MSFDPNNSEQFLAYFEQAIAQTSARSELFLVLVYNKRGEDYDEIERVLQDTHIMPVFFLEGGSNAYKQFVARQTQIKQGQQQELTTPCQPCARQPCIR